jgi:hypothetical protein
MLSIPAAILLFWLVAGLLVASVAAGALFQIAAWRPDKDKSGNPFACAAKGIADLFGIGRPSGQPAPDKTLRMRRIQQLHTGGSSG